MRDRKYCADCAYAAAHGEPVPRECIECDIASGGYDSTGDASDYELPVDDVVGPEGEEEW